MVYRFSSPPDKFNLPEQSQCDVIMALIAWSVA